MKAQCERCKEIVALVFRAEPGAILVTCPSCAAEYLVPASAPEAVAPDEAARSTPPVPPPASASPPRAAPAAAPRLEVTCPKCGEPQPRASACRRCGLAAERWAGWQPVAAAAADPSATQADLRLADKLFAGCEERWDEPARHDAFVAHCERAGAFAHAAASYRRQTRPDRLAVALERLTQIRTLAERALVVLPRPAPGGRGARERSSLKLLLALLIVLLVLGAAFVLAGRLDPGERTPARPRPAPPAPR